MVRIHLRPPAFMLEENVLDPHLEENEAEIVFDQSLRPRNLDDFVGQEKIKDNLKILLEAATRRRESAEHVLLYGNAGLGKTTLAHIIASETSSPIRITSGPALERVGDLAAILSNLETGNVLFIDEIHRMNKTIEEVLYPAMEDFALDLVVGKGPAARTLRLNLPRFTLIGATTKISLLSAPLRDRFGSTFHLDYYNDDEIKSIVGRSAQLLGVKMDDKSASEIAKRSRGVPRVANRLLRRIRDYAEVKNNGIINLDLVFDALKMQGIDDQGLNKTDREILKSIIEKFNGGPVGLKTLAAAVSEEEETVEEINEPFLLRLGFLARTPKGRVATDSAYKHLGKEIPLQNKLV
jgi:Holliday junction DNA helicase RuvB